MPKDPEVEFSTFRLWLRRFDSGASSPYCRVPILTSKTQGRFRLPNANEDLNHGKKSWLWANYLHVRFSRRRNSKDGKFSKWHGEWLCWEWMASTSNPSILAMCPLWQCRIQGLWLWLGLLSIECSTHGEELTGVMLVSSSKISSSLEVSTHSISMHIPWCHFILFTQTQV